MTGVDAAFFEGGLGGCGGCIGPAGVVELAAHGGDIAEIDGAVARRERGAGIKLAADLCVIGGDHADIGPGGGVGQIDPGGTRKCRGRDDDNRGEKKGE